MKDEQLEGQVAGLIKLMSAVDKKGTDDIGAGAFWDTLDNNLYPYIKAGLPLHESDVYLAVKRLTTPRMSDPNLTVVMLHIAGTLSEMKRVMGKESYADVLAIIHKQADEQLKRVKEEDGSDNTSGNAVPGTEYYC